MTKPIKTTATYKRLTLAQRYLIQTLHQQRQTQHQIAQQTRVSQATISRELARNAHRLSNFIRLSRPKNEQLWPKLVHLKNSKASC